jgi:hypothetical protein
MDALPTGLPVPCGEGVVDGLEGDSTAAAETASIACAAGTASSIAADSASVRGVDTHGHVQHQQQPLRADFPAPGALEHIAANGVADFALCATNRPLLADLAQSQ